MSKEAVELLDSLISGDEMTPDKLDELLVKQVPEDLYLDYKDGKLLDDRKKAAAVIRQYVSGFANSSGGILLVGVEDKTWQITGCTAPSGGSLVEWAARCLTSIAPHFSPPPEIQEVKHSKGSVLVIAVGRSSGLVPCIENGQLAYYLRLGDQTLAAPDYLISDLMLGRREYPYLSITELKFQARAEERNNDNTRILTFGLDFVIENNSFSWAEDVNIGVLGWVERGTVSLSQHLLSHLEIKPLENLRNGHLYNVCHKPIPGGRSSISLNPFSRNEGLNSSSYTIPLRVNDQHYSFIWKGAVYLIAKATPPVWYQLSIHVNTGLKIFVKDSPNAPLLDSKSDLIEIERVSGKKPLVAWEKFIIQ